MLWASSDPAEWQAALDTAEECAAAKPKLAPLDRWYWAELPQAIRSRSPSYLTKAELVKLVDWKLSRGKFRPQLTQFASAHSESVVEDASRQAYAAAPAEGPLTEATITAALKSLTELKGMGPATASAVLAAFDAAFPFMSDEALATCLPGAKKEYTARAYLRLCKAVGGKARELSTSGRSWSAKEVERALWAAAMKEKGTGNKRKR